MVVKTQQGSVSFGNSIEHLDQDCYTQFINYTAKLAVDYYNYYVK